MTTALARHPNETRTREQERLEDYRRRAAAFGVRRREEPKVDRALSDSFPASDPPPWTLGISRSFRSPAGLRAAPVQRTSRRSRAGRARFWNHAMTLLGAIVVALAFSAAILLIGAALALVLRLGLEAVTWIAGALTGAAW